MSQSTHALFLIDLQVGNIDHLFQPDLIIKANQTVLQIAREAGIDIFHFKYHEEKRDYERFGEPWTAVGTIEGEFHSKLAPSGSEITYTKPAYGAFTVEGLEKQLKEKGIETIWLTGVMSQVCVLATAYEAYARKFKVNVIQEAVGATSENNLNIGLEWMRKYASALKTLKEFEKHFEPK